MSLERLLGPLTALNLLDIDWVIVGGKSGPRARPMDPTWVTDLRDQCRWAKVPFFFRQWGGKNKKQAGRSKLAPGIRCRLSAPLARRREHANKSHWSQRAEKTLYRVPRHLSRRVLKPGTSESTPSVRRSTRRMPLGAAWRKTGMGTAAAATLQKHQTRAALTPSSRCPTSSRHSHVTLCG